MLRFAVIGHPVAHSLSPCMHAANFAALGLEATYGKCDVAPEALKDFIRDKAREGYRGLNVTIPHKRAVIDCLDRADESVTRYGACNTLRFEPDGTIWGWNTDVIGFYDCLAAHGFTLPGRRVLVLGCGGAGRAIAAACRDAGASHVAVAARHEANAVRCAGELDAASCVAVPLADATAVAREADLVVNATPVGLKMDEASVLPREAFRPGQFVLDMIPTRHFPPTAAAARAAGAEAVDGLEFLVGQGARSFEIWTGLKADRAAMLAACRQEAAR